MNAQHVMPDRENEQTRREKTGLILSAALLILVLLVSAGLPRAASGVPAGGKGAPRRSPVEMVFFGNTILSSSSLRSSCAVSGDLSEQEMSAKVSQRVLAAYRDIGYLDAAVESTSVSKTSGGNRLVVHVREGQSTRIGSFRFVGNRHFSSTELVAASGLREGMTLTGGLLDAALERIVGHLADRGFPFAAAKIGDFSLDDRSLDFVFMVDEGPLCTVGDVSLENSGALNSKALRRALGVRLGEEYSEKDLRRGLSYLKRTGLFTGVGEPVVAISAQEGQPFREATDESKVRITIPVREKKTTSVSGAVGFRGRTNEVTGGLSLSLLNIARTGRSAKAGWEATGGNVSNFHFSYAEPWVMGLPFTSAVSFEQVVRDTFYAHTAVGVVLKVPMSSLVSGEIGANFEKGLNTEGTRTRTSRLAWLGGIELLSGGSSWSSENSFLATLEGTRGEKKIAYLSESRTEKEVFSTLTGRVFLQRRLKGSQIALVDVKASAILEGRQLATQDELFALGGKRTLRGYSERQFLAQTVGSVQFEYGLAVGEDGGRVFGFLDCGYASTQALSTAARFHTGYGIGLRVPSPIGLAGIDFGLPSGESLGSGKIHVGLEGTF
ncbi:MAG: BamA/TamA family outer membrane protein [Candidatus Eisenbacteria bacterium]|nr:BamA/TamA family outer membrane protein [Candidatus Eisenbacteria bacterium]